MKKPRSRKPARSKKGKKERARLEKHSTTRIVGEGFVQRVRKPEVTGKNKKSVMLRVDAGFAAWVREQAAIDGSITEVTRKLHHRVVQAAIDARASAINLATPTEGSES